MLKDWYGAWRRKTTILPSWQTAATNVPAGHPVTIKLPEGPRTILRLEVAAKAENRAQWSKLTLRILRDVP